jgi:hypothetical protein
MNERLVHALWRKSSYSSANGSCVEIAENLPGIVAVRDSKNPEGGTLVFTPETWRAFISEAHAGEFDLS